MTLGKSLKFSVPPFHHLLNYTISEGCFEDSVEKTLKGAWLFKGGCKHVVIIIVKWTDLRRRLLCWRDGREASMAGEK